MTCPICENKPANCDCSQEAKELFYLREKVEEMMNEDAVQESFLTAKQKERREFVMKYLLAVINGYYSQPGGARDSDEDFLAEAKFAARRFDLLDEQLTELEEKENGK